jgi:pimeloyl-ACP methyl ester carboxylesterase
MGNTEQAAGTRSYQSRFKSPEDADRFLSAYNATLALWPVPHEAITVTTSFGSTYINVAGAPHLPPLFLIPGAQMSSTVWYPNVEPLSLHFRVYALDMIDQMGLSQPTRRLKTPQDCVDWLAEVLNALSLESVTLIGHSQGCWQVLNLARSAPQRVARMVLLSPSLPFSQPRWQMFVRMLPVFIMPTRSMFYWNMQWLTTLRLDKDQPHPLIEQLMIGAMAFKPGELGTGIISTFTDDELRQISIPSLLLMGEHERVVDPHRVLERSRLMPRLEAGIIKDAGHLMPVDRTEATNARMLEFLVNP